MSKPKDDDEPVSQPKPTEYTVMARRYRPQQFSQLIGQESVAQALSNALTGNRVAHAYLFTGGRGVGKTSAARILAKALNCVHGPTPTPCDTCETCRSIIAGEDVDVLEIDGASNRRIEEIRDIRQNVSFMPSRSRCKIYIIDEVHMLTREAFNALLKTLEEPPAHVKFIFATTEVQKVPITILSRCQRFDFGLIATARIAEHLRLIVKQEELEADNDAIELIARRAAGSMRDAESLLDQVLSYGEKLTPDLVHRMLGTMPADRVAAIAESVISQNATTAIKHLTDARSEGTQPGELVDQLVEFWRDLLLVASCGSAAPSVYASLKVLEPLSKATSVDSILAGMDILTATKSRMKFSGHPFTLLEMALIRLARLDQLMNIGDALSASSSGQTATPSATQSRVKSPTNLSIRPVEKKKLMTLKPLGQLNSQNSQFR